MDMKDVVKRLENEPCFREWKKTNKDSYLAYAFMMIDEPDKDWQVGYYNKNGTMTTFTIEKADIRITPEEEVFKQPKTKVKKLDISSVKVEFDKALEIAVSQQQKKYKKDSPLKRIIILQCLDIGTVWNITFVTQCFNTLNFKISSSDGKIKEEKLTPLMSFAQQN